MNVYTIMRRPERIDEKQALKKAAAQIAAAEDKRLSWRNGGAVIYIRGDRNYTVSYSLTPNEFLDGVRMTPAHTISNSNR